MRPCFARPALVLEELESHQFPPTPPAPATASTSPLLSTWTSSHPLPSPPLLSPLLSSLQEGRVPTRKSPEVRSFLHPLPHIPNYQAPELEWDSSNQVPAESSCLITQASSCKVHTERSASIQFTQRLWNTCCMPGSVLALRRALLFLLFGHSQGDGRKRGQQHYRCFTEVQSAREYRK